jgi:hypothetical protein
MKKLLCILLAITLHAHAQRPVLEIDVVATDANDGFVGLSEVSTAGLATNTVARVKGGTTPGDGGGGDYLWNGSTWVAYSNTSAGLSEEELLALGFVKLVNGKIPAIYLPGPTSSGVFADRQNLSLFLGAGQSNSLVQTASAAVTTVNPNPDIVTGTGGVNSSSAEFDSLVVAVEDNEPSQSGFSSGETGLVVMANEVLNYAANAGADPGPRYLVAETGVSSATLALLSKGGGSSYYEDYLLPIIVAAGNYATANSLTIDLPLVRWRQGEGGTSPATISDYKAQLSTYRDDVQADAAANLSRETPLKILSYQPSRFGGTGTISAEALWELHRDSTWLCIAAPAYVVYGQGLYSALDNIHFTSEGAELIGYYEGITAAEFLYTTEKPKRLQPVSATVDGTTVTVDFQVPFPPIVLDQSWIPAVQDYGIKCIDDSGTLTLSNIAVATSTSITFEVNRSITTGGEVRIGLDYDFTGSRVPSGNTGTATNIRDSSPVTKVVGGVTRNLYNPALISKVSIGEGSGPASDADLIWVTRTDSGTAYSSVAGSGTITELEASPTFDASSMTVASTAALSLNTTSPRPAAASYWAVVHYENGVSDDGLIMGNKNGGFSDDGWIALFGADRVSFITPSGGNILRVLDTGYTGWVFYGVAIEDGKVRTYINPAAASGSSTSETVVTHGAAASPTVELGKGSYTGSTANTAVKYAGAGYADEYFTEAQWAEVMADMANRLGITLN